MSSLPPFPEWIPRRLMTVEEAAEILHLSIRQLRRLIAEGRLEVIRLGRSVRITPEAVVALLGLM